MLLNFVFLFSGYIVSHPLDRSASLFIVMKGQCVAVDNNGFTSTHGPGATIGLAGLWFGKTLKTVICKTYVDGFLIPGEKIREALELMTNTRRAWIEVYLRTLPALYLCEQYLDSHIHSDNENIIHNLIRQFQDCFNKGKRHVYQHRVKSFLLCQLEMTSVNKKLFVFGFMMGSVYFLSAWISTYAVVFGDFDKVQLHISCFLDSLILTEAVYKLTFITSASGVSAMKKQLLNPYFLLILLPTDFIFLPLWYAWRTQDSWSFYGYRYGKLFIRFLRFLEPLRRMSAFKTECPQHIAKIVLFETILRTTGHVHILALFYHFYHCSVGFSYDGVHLRCQQRYFHEAFYNVKMFGQFLNASSYITPGNTIHFFI